MHQMTAYGGKAGPVPFAQAVPQSPGFLPITSNYAQQSTFDRLLELTGAADLAALRTLPEQALVTANSIQVGEAAYGTFVYGPVSANVLVAFPAATFSLVHAWHSRGETRAHTAADDDSRSSTATSCPPCRGSCCCRASSTPACAS